MPSCVWVRVPSLAQKKDDVESTPRHLFFARASGLQASLPSVTDVTSPQGEYTSPTFGRSRSHRTAEGSLVLFLREPRASRLLSPLSLARHLPRENTRLRRLVARTISEQTEDPSTTFCASFGRTPNEDGGLLPPGRATRITLTISTLGIFRVVKTTTLISVKQLIHSNLQVALQNAETLAFCFHVNLFLRFSWAKVRNHKKTR